MKPAGAGMSSGPPETDERGPGAIVFVALLAGVDLGLVAS
jgi:hypothetical protein